MRGARIIPIKLLRLCRCYGVGGEGLAPSARVPAYQSNTRRWAVSDIVYSALSAGGGDQLGTGIESFAVRMAGNSARYQGASMTMRN